MDSDAGRGSQTADRSLEFAICQVQPTPTSKLNQGLAANLYPAENMLGRAAAASLHIPRKMENSRALRLVIAITAIDSGNSNGS